MNIDPLRADEHATLSIEGAVVEVTRVRGEEALSQLFRYDVSVVPSATTAHPAALLAKEVELALRDGFGGERVVRGIVAEARLTIEDDGKPRVAISIRPRAHVLALGVTSAVFQEMSVVDIVKRVVERAGVPARFETVRAYPARVYTAQYRESNWSFISHLCEDAGIYAWFDHEEGSSILVFADTSTAAPDLVGGANVRFETARGMGIDGETIEELGPVVRVTTGGFALGSFDPANPRFKVGAKAGEAGVFHVYDAPGGSHEEEAMLTARVAAMNEAARAERATVIGKGTSARLVPGRVMKLFNHPADRFDRRFLVTGVTVDVVQRERGGGERGAGAIRAKELLRRAKKGVFAVASAGTADGGRRFSVAFRALDQKVPFRAPLATPTPVRPGLQSGVVVGPAGAEVHPDDSGRVRVQLHWDREGARDEKAGRWMRVAQRGTAGSMLLPRTGWNVMTMNLEGGPGMPMVVSRLFDALHPPPYGLPENMTMTSFKTATTPGGGSFNEIRYDDKGGAQEMFVNASRDMNVLVQDAKSEDVKSNMTRTVGANCSLEVGQNWDETIGGNQTTNIGGNELEKVGKARDKSVGGDEKSTIGASRNLKVKGSSETSVTGTRELSVGVAQIDISLGNIELKTTMLKEFVGVAVVRLTPRDIAENVGAASIGASTVAAKLGAKGAVAKAAGLVSFSVGVGGVVQTIGGAKIELCTVERSISTTKSYRETVGGMMSLKGRRYLDEASTTSSIKAKTELSATAETLLALEAEEMIEIECGASKIVLLSTGVLIQSTAVDLSGAIVEADAKVRVDHNL